MSERRDPGRGESRRLDASPVTVPLRGRNTPYSAASQFALSELRFEIRTFVVSSAFNALRSSYIARGFGSNTLRKHVTIARIRTALTTADATRPPGRANFFGQSRPVPTSVEVYVGAVYSSDVTVRRTPRYAPTGPDEPRVMPNYLTEASAFIASHPDDYPSRYFVARHTRLAIQHAEHPRPYLINVRSDVHRREDGRGRRPYYDEPGVRENFRLLGERYGGKPVDRLEIDDLLNAADAMRELEYHRRYVILKASEYLDRHRQLYGDDEHTTGGPPSWWEG